MKRLVTVFGTLGMAIAMGCAEDGNSGAGDNGNGEGIKIEFPGGSVKIGEDGVDVRAPGVDVQVDKKKGVDVKAPGVGVQVEKDKRVGVQAPGVDFKLESGGSEGE